VLVKTGVRPAVTVWGAIIALAGVWIVFASEGLEFSGEIAMIVLLAAAGMTLTLSALIAGARRTRASTRRRP
jgi:hypothetical protein